MGRIKRVEPVGPTSHTNDSTYRGRSQRGSGFDEAKSFRKKLQEAALKQEKKKSEKSGKGISTGKNEDRIVISPESRSLYEEMQRKRMINGSEQERE